MRELIFSKNFMLLFIANFVICTTYLLIMTIMARYAVISFACSDSLAGLAASVFMVGGLLGRVVAGRYANIWGQKRLAVISMATLLAASVCYLISDVSYALLVVIRIVHGLAFGVAGTILPSIILSKFPKEHMGEGTGIFALSVSLGNAVGPMLGLFLSNSISFDVMFYSGIILCAIGFVSTIFVTGGEKDEKLSAELKAEKFTWRSFFLPDTAYITIFMMILALAYMSLNSFINSFAIEIGLSAYTPFTFLAFAIGNMVFRPLFGRIMDKHGENTVIYPSIIFMGIGLVMMANVHGPIMLISVGIFMALGFGSAVSMAQAVAVRRVKPEQTALAIGTFFLLCDSASALAPFLMGFVVGAFGYRVMFMVGAGLCVVSFVTYYFTHGRRASAAKKAAKASAN